MSECTREREEDKEKERVLLICGGGWTDIESSIMMKYKIRKERDNLKLETTVRKMCLVVRKVFRKEERETS